ncbi:hypothetical protein PPYR_10422 [Photinus pyralis]|uniref:Spermatogenesis-associated protein 17 n=1 Tax=Photinus pyralis TaxID=7054 RepID=A0A5N4AGB4_PHOPY|nr:spermatogenesis-associated protein 17-like [Photinus pyralis]KAB0796361.1 hypothetical protein PPYR_10422 [Photinus pyralis]
MASVRQYIRDAEIFPVHIIKKYAAFEDIGKKRHFAALKIQRVFRGYLVRKLVERWHRAAIVLQKFVRRWLVLWHLPQFYEEYLQWRNETYYHRMATRIQAAWRGYKVRKGRVPIKELLRRRLSIERLNEKIVLSMRDAFKNLEKEKMEQMNREAEGKVAFIIFKLHHHLRTYQREGIYSRHNSKQLSPIEVLFHSLPLRRYMDDLRRRYYSEVGRERPPRRYMFLDKKMQEIEDLYRNFERSKPVTEISVPVDVVAHDKPFDLLSKPAELRFERRTLCRDQYPSPPFKLERTVDRSKHVAEEDFDLFVHKKCAKGRGPPPYYIDHWTKRCEEHYWAD